MITVKGEIREPVEVDVVTSNGEDINSILQDICEEAHDGLTYASMIRSETEDGYENMSKCDILSKYIDIVEVLEGKLCHILELLND